MFDGVPTGTVRICKDIYKGTKLPEARNKNKGKGQRWYSKAMLIDKKNHTLYSALRTFLIFASC